VDSYGVVTIGDHLLSLVGLSIYVLLVTLGFWMVASLTDGIPRRYRLLNLAVYGVLVLAIVTWGFKILGLDFYVEA
jgi:hypothetical protein